MGTIVVPGPISGRNYRIRIGGDSPTVDDQQFIDAFVRQREQEFAAQYQERFGENLLPSRGVGAQVGEFFRGIPRGVGGIFETAGLGAITPFEEETELGLREGIRGLGQRLQGRFAPQIGREDMVGGRLGEAVGSMLGIGGVGLGTTAATAPFAGPAAPFLGLGAAAATGAAAGAGEASERARAFGATQEERNLATRLGLIPGALEVVPLVRLSRVLERGGLRERLVRAAITGGEEAVQEAASNIAQNLIEQGVYNPEQGTFTDTGEALGYGFGAGALVQAMLDLALPGRLRGRAGEGTPPPADPEAASAPLAEPPPRAVPDGQGELFDNLPQQRAPLPPSPAQGALDLPEPVYRGPQGEFDLGTAMPGSQADLFRAGPSVAAPTPPEVPSAPTTPAATPVPGEAPLGRTDLLRVLEDLGVPRSVPVYQQVRSGRIVDQDGLNEGLRTYASKLNADNPRRVAIEAMLSAPPVTPADVPAEAAMDLGLTPPTQETPDVAAGLGTAGAGARPADSVAQQRPGLTTPADTTPAPAPDGRGLDARGAPAQPVDDAAGAQPDTLDPDVPAPAAEAPRATPPSPTSSPATGDAASIEATTQRWNDLTGRQKAATAAELGVPEARVPDRIAIDPEGVNNAIEDALAPLSDARTRVDPRTLRPIGPRVTATPPVDQAPSRVAEAMRSELEAQRAADIDRVASQQERALQAQAKAAVSAWFEQNADADTKAGNDALRAAGDADTTAFRAEDVAPVLGLLNGPAPTTSAQKNLEPAAMAYRYFSRYRDPGLALSAMANDAAEAAAHERHMADRRAEGKDKAQDGLFGPPTWTAANLASVAGGEKIALSPEDRLMVGLGRNPGKRAMEWAQANLSPETRADLVRLMEAPATKDQPGYSWTNHFDRAAVRDRIRGKRQGARGTIDETLAPEALSRDERQAAQEAADLRRQEWQSLTDEQRRVRQLRGDFSAAWPLTAHPHVGALIRAGDFTGAVRTLALTAPTRTLRRLAQKLLPRLQNVRSQTVTGAELARIRAVLSPETPTLGMPYSAVYIWPMSPDAIQTLRDNGHNEAADLATQYSGQVLFDETVPISAELALHEALHAAADNVLTNPAHPLTRQLETLRQDLLKTMPATEYGLLNVRELLSEGMTNPVFRRDLTYLSTKGEPRSAWQRFKDIMHNFMRTLMGLPPREPGRPRTARDLVDQTLDDILALSPDDASSGDIMGASFGFMQGARQALDNFKDRTRVPNEQDFAAMQRMAADASIPVGWKNTFMSLFMPLRYVQDAARSYLPSADMVNNLISEHKSARDKIENTIKNSGKLVEDLVRPHMRDDNQMSLLTRVVYEPQEFSVDPRAQDGNVKYKDDPEQLDAWRRYNTMWNQMNPDMQKAANAIWGRNRDIVRPALQRGVLAGLEAVAPNKKPITDRIFKDVYQKLFSEAPDVPYAGLSRQGTFWLSYGANDPTTGEFKYYKQSFVTEAQQADAIRKLEALNAAARGAGRPAVATEINPYRNAPGNTVRPKESLDIIARVLATVDGFSELANVVDPTTGETKDVRQEIINMVFDNMPETSFIQSFRQRKFTPGYDGDFTILTEGVVPGDVVGNTLKSALSQSQRAVDLEYGARFSGVREQLRREFRQYQNSVPAGKDPVRHAQDVNTASVYLNQLVEATRAPFMVRGALSGGLTGGAYMLTLGYNISTALLTLTSLPLFAATIMFGKHGMADITSAMGAAHRLLTASGRHRKAQRVNGEGQLEDFSQDVGMFNFSGRNYDVTQPQNRWMAIAQEIGDKNAVFYNSLIQDTLLGENPSFIQKLAGHSSILQHTAERYSREVSFWSAYLLELHRLSNRPVPFNQFVEGVRNGTIQPTEAVQRDAATAAVEIADRANGPLFAAAGPQMSRGDIGSVLYLFKRHPLSMTNLMLQTAYRSTPWGTSPELKQALDQAIAANDTARQEQIRQQIREERKVFQRQAGAMYGMMGLMAGALGLPLMQQIGWLYDLFAEDDEPKFEAQMRIWMGEAGSRGLVNWLTNTSISDRIGLGDAIYRPNSLADQLPPVWRFAEGVGGPVVGLIGKYTQRVPDLWRQGEYWRTAEAIAPSSLGNILRAARFGNEGVLTMRGDPIVSDVGPYSVVAQAMGFMSAEYGQQLAVNAERTRISSAINTRKSRLLQQLNRAINDNDVTREREIRAQIDEFNRRNPDNQITRETEQRSMRGYMQTRAQMEYGVNITPANRQRIDEMLQYGRSWAGAT